ncbi:MAG: hypothetical protein LBU73_08470 [Helicobacteraceae bacterium]|jgi:DNA polymerase III delta subunit|nr:hypothetical protein [Helicobacteraceae bacterium]
MKQFELDKLFDKKQAIKTLIVTDDQPLCEIYAGKYLKSLPSDLSAMKLYYDEYDLISARDHLSAPGLFNDGNLLIIRSAKKIPFKEIEQLIEITYKNSAAYMLIFYEAEDYKDIILKAEKLEREKNLAAVRLFAPKPQIAVNFLLENAREKNINLTPDLADHILRINNNNLSFAIADLDKLALYDEINIPLIDKISAGHSEGDNTKLIQALIEKRAFYEELSQLLNENGEMQVLLSLYRDFQTLFTHRLAQRLGKDARDFLGYNLPPDVASARANLSSRVNMRQFLAIFELLSDLEARFKGDLEDASQKSSALYAALITLQTKLL